MENTTVLEELTFKIKNFFGHNREREAILVIHQDTLDQLITESHPVTFTLELEGTSNTKNQILDMYGLRMTVFRSPDAEEILIAKTFFANLIPK